jgi:hypothetical protein
MLAKVHEINYESWAWTTAEDCYEHGNIPSGSIYFLEFPGWLKNYWLNKKGLISMKVKYFITNAQGQLQ